MAQTLRLKRSSVPGRVPTTATLQTGEIAINTADGLVYIRKDDDSIIPLLGANTTVTGSVVLLGSIEATSFTGSFSGSFVGPITGTLSKTIGSGNGIVSFLFDGSDNVTVTLDTGSDHFRNAVIDLIDTNAPSIIAQDTTGPSGIDLSYNSSTGALSGSLVYSDIQLGSTTIQLGNSAAAVTGFTVTGSFKGNIEGTASWANNATSASHALIADYALNVDTGSLVTTGSVSNATLTFTKGDSSTFNLTVDNVASASYASFATTAQTALNVNTGSLIETGSVSNATVTFYKANGTSFDLTVNNVQSASYAANASTADLATTASYGLSASYAESSTFSTFASNGAKVLISTANTAPDKYYLTFTTGSGYNFLQIDPEVLSYFPATNTLDHKGILIVSGNILLTGVVEGDDILINDWGSVSASLAAIEAGANNLTLQQVTDNGSSTTNSITAPSFTGSLLGTASYADFAFNATSASYATFTAFAQDAISASYAATASSAENFLVRGDATVNGDLTVEGIVTAREFHTTFISASITYSSGSTKFGDTADDIHQFTGSVVVSGSIDSDDITIDQWGSVSASLALLSGSITSLTLQQVTDSGNSTNLVISASNLNITGFPDVSASLAAISASAANAYGLTLQQVTDNGNQTTNHVSISSSLNVQNSIYSKGEEVLDFAVAMAIALG